MSALIEKKLRRIPLRVEEGLVVVIDADVTRAQAAGTDSNRNLVIRDILKRHYRHELQRYYRDQRSGSNRLPQNQTHKPKTGH